MKRGIRNDSFYSETAYGSQQQCKETAGGEFSMLKGFYPISVPLLFKTKYLIFVCGLEIS